MRRVLRLVPFFALLLIGILDAPWSGAGTRAQEATPGAEVSIEDEGDFLELAGLASGVDLPSPADLMAVRFGIEPEGAILFIEDDPTGGMLLVESGTLTVWVDAPWTVSRANMLAGTMATAEATGEFAPAIEEIEAGEEVTLGAGDSAYIPFGVEAEIRNDSQDPAVGLAFTIAPAGAITGEATPEP